MRQLHSEHRALNTLHAVIETNLVVIVTHGGAVFAQGTGALGKFRVVGHERAAFPGRAEILAGIKTEAGHRAERADGLAFVFCAMRLGGVFDHR